MAVDHGISGLVHDPDHQVINVVQAPAGHGDG
jgi:hypothetical protein